jgi:DNA-binding beta-propeller fold protein YncE
MPQRGAFLADGTLLFSTELDLRTWDPGTGEVAVVLPVGTRLLDVAIDSTDDAIVWFVAPSEQELRRWNRDTGVVDVLASGFSFPHNGNPEPAGGIAVSADGGTVYVADGESHAVYAVDAGSGDVSVLAGEVESIGADDGPAPDARFWYPTDVTLDPSTGTLYVADTNNHRIRAIDLGSGQVSTVVGTGAPTCEVVDLLVPAICDEQYLAGDGGPASAATLYRPFGIELDGEGNLLVADTYDHRFRVIHGP